MNIGLSVIIFLEIFATVLIVFGFLHEEKFVRFEDRIKRKMKRFIRKKKRNLASKWLAEQGIVIPKQ